VSGLEIFDEAANRWFRPELRARDVWESERNKQNQVINDRNVDHETCRIPNDGVEKEFTIPWHSRYLVVLPGELLQLCTRSEVPASVHRVVTVTNGAKRFSAPVLLRARPGMRMDVSKYFGSLQKAGPLLTESNGMKMEEIHDALQPSSFR
jgi:isopenicillin N synthase-like dioxygenase